MVELHAPTHRLLVDDTIAFEIIPRNSISILDLVVREIHEYCIEHKMKLNPKREMYINFMTNSVIHCDLYVLDIKRLNALERISF